MHFGDILKIAFDSFLVLDYVTQSDIGILTLQEIKKLKPEINRIWLIVIIIE